MEHKENRIQVKQMNDHIYLMDDAGEATGYVVIGSKKALVIDTMNGLGDVKAVVRSLTGLPVMVVNTHGHCDHIFGNIFFEEAFLNPLDMEIAKEHSQMLDARQTAERNLSMPPFREIRDGDVIDLGGLTVEIIGLPGHTPGSILLLVKEDRILFTGDAINRHLWLQLEHSLPLADSLKNLEKVMYLTEQADHILHGHATDFEPISLMDELLEGLKDLCAGNRESDVPYEWFGGTARLHPFADGKSAIIYQEQMPDLSAYFQSVLEQDTAPVVICDLKHTIIYMNPAAVSNYAKRGGKALVGKSLLDCHNAGSCERIKEVLKWFAEDISHNVVHTFYNEKQKKDVYMVALRGEDHGLIGYYEKHAFREPDQTPFYEMR